MKELFLAFVKGLWALMVAYIWTAPKNAVLAAYYWVKATYDDCLRWVSLRWVALKTWLRLKLQ
jgi:hypothetical protein